MSESTFKLLTAALMVILAGCTKDPVSTTDMVRGASTSNPSRPPISIPSPVDQHETLQATTKGEKLVLPVGTVLRVRLYNSIDTTRARLGDSFLAALSTPVTLGHQAALPRGTIVRGTIKNLSTAGRFKGRASVTLTLNRMEWNDTDLSIDTNSVTWTSADHKRRNLAWIGGGSGVGALIGGLVGGAKGALIGAGAGLGAGFTGAAITGKRKVRIPAESVLTFRLVRPISI